MGSAKSAVANNCGGLLMRSAHKYFIKKVDFNQKASFPGDVCIPRLTQSKQENIHYKALCM